MTEFEITDFAQLNNSSFHKQLVLTLKGNQPDVTASMHVEVKLKFPEIEAQIQA